MLRGYARIFNNPDFKLKPEERNKRYRDIADAARSIESLMDPILDSYANGTTGITEEEKRVCQDALRSPLQTLIGMADVIIEANGQIPHDEYMQLRSEICRDAYQVSTSTNKLVLFSLYGDDIPTPKDDYVSLNETARSILNGYEMPREGSPLSEGRNFALAREFRTDVGDDVKIYTNQILQELLNCLLDNVSKHATGGALLMNCHAHPNGTYSIAVSNEGPVIPAADAERIFDPFVRLSPDEHGLGIGLPLARRLAISMGYTITIDLNYTKGVRFVVSGI